MRFGSLAAGRWISAAVAVAALGVGCSLANAPDDVKAGTGAGGAGGAGSTATTGTDATTGTTTTGTTTSSTTTTTGTTTSTGAGGSMCPDGYADCNGDPGDACEAKLDTPEHCGACATTCDAAAMHVATPACTAGACDYDACADGYDDCDQDRANGCEAKLDALDSCGKCGVVCAPANVATATCTGGACGYDACQPGFSDCDNDATNGCETAAPTCCAVDCPVGGQCINGVCTLTKWSEGTNAWPDEACNPTSSFGGCDTNAQDQADSWATFVCQQNGFKKGVWTGNKVGGCNGDVSMWCGGDNIPCQPVWENTCSAGDQTKVEITCTK